MPKTVSVSPHIRSEDSIQKIMWSVVLALTPALLGALYFFGFTALKVTLTCVLTCVATEHLIIKYFQRPGNIKDGSAVLTGLLLAFCLPPTAPLWIPLIGGAFAIIVAKHTFGGLGHNIFNPALAGRSFLMASWPALMTAWVLPFDAVTSATPLGVSKLRGMEILKAQNPNLYLDLFTGNVGGCLGETSAILLLLGAIFLLYKGIIRPHTPFSYLLSVAVFSTLLGQDPVLHLFAGGLILGAFFMATDYVTTPLTFKGKIIFGVCCGILTVVIRLYSGLPEGVSYSILIMNAFTPLIDRYTKKTEGVA
ncbi:MAG: RnfABCDGE type electron transport complex subunit D [Candidatus Altiarchaeales archaeon]|nr:RnfABCDGE type electron transport complex subunit D [Candidatus Altiarchaeales archaeon]